MSSLAFSKRLLWGKAKRARRKTRATRIEANTGGVYGIRPSPQPGGVYGISGPTGAAMEPIANGRPITALAFGLPASAKRLNRDARSFEPEPTLACKSLLAVRVALQPGFAADTAPLPGGAVFAALVAQDLPGLAVGEKPFCGCILCGLAKWAVYIKGSRPPRGILLKGRGAIPQGAAAAGAAIVPEGLYFIGGLLPEEGVGEPLGRKEFGKFQGPNSEAGSSGNPL